MRNQIQNRIEKLETAVIPDNDDSPDLSGLSFIELIFGANETPIPEQGTLLGWDKSITDGLDALTKAEYEQILTYAEQQAAAPLE